MAKCTGGYVYSNRYVSSRDNSRIRAVNYADVDNVASSTGNYSVKLAVVSASSYEMVRAGYS